MGNDRFKFKAWDKKRNRMHAGSIDNLCLSLGGLLMWQFGYNAPELLSEEAIQDYILLQSTGLRDSEGTLIWEGDIIFDEVDNTSTVVYWNDKYGCYRTKVHNTEEMGLYDYSLQPMATVMKVIGNIYEHAELLKQSGPASLEDSPGRRREG